MNEGFGGIKDILILGRKKNFIDNFKIMNETLSSNMGTNTALAQVPRYFIEMIAFGIMITLILYLIATHDSDLGIILPVLSVYALATFKLLPAFQQIYASFSVIKGNVAAFESIRQDLFTSQKSQLIQQTLDVNSMSFEQQLTLKNISFNYPNKPEPAIKTLTYPYP